MSRSLYMHTLDGRPAFFQDGWIVFAGNEIPRLETSLQAIRSNELKCIDNRNEAGFSDNSNYGYVRIKKTAIPNAR